MISEVTAARAAEVGPGTTVAVPVFEGRTVPEAGLVDIDLGYLERVGFEGRLGEVEALLADDGDVVLAVGVGRRDGVDERAMRRAAASAVRGAGRAQSLALALLPALVDHVDKRAASQAMAEGAALATYRYEAYRSSPRSRSLRSVVVVDGDRSAVAAGMSVARGQAIARDLANEPPQGKTPRLFAEAVERHAANAGLAVEVWDEALLENERCSGLLAVGRGSSEPSRLVKLTYEPRNPTRRTRTLALVGKGITFDSGGLSLKTPEGMTTMKVDMSGAAAVLGALVALSEIGPPVRIVGWCCLAENMPGPGAIKPGDVIAYRDGTTVEVLNTDAEGRLVLADGLIQAAAIEPNAIVDVATLTGGVVAALGRDVSGLFTSDDALAERIGEAADRAGENIWRLPLHTRYRKNLDSDVADMKNVAGAGPQAAAIHAALFLEHFTNGVPWAHLDIAGTARSDTDDAEVSRGATGVAVRTLVELGRRFGRS